MVEQKVFGIGRWDPAHTKGTDKHGSQRTVPMEVLVLGMPRTGTASMREALFQLGYHDVYHMASCIENIPDNDIWNEAVSAKWLKKGKSFGRAEFDQVLGHCMAVTDFPCAAFALELIEAYPEAKVVLTTRDVDSWYKSITLTIGKAIHNPVIIAVGYIDPFALGKWQWMARRLWKAYFGTLELDDKVLKSRFLKHYEDVRKAVPNDRILEYSAGDGWEPLCEFLGKKIPAEPYPRVNESANFEKSLFTIINSRLKVLLKTAVSVLVPVSVAGVALYFARQQTFSRFLSGSRGPFRVLA